MTTNKKLYSLVAILGMPTLALLGCGVGGMTEPPGGGGADAHVSQVQCGTVTGTPDLELGGGNPQTGFVELSAGSDMLGVLGPQGLYMVTPSVRAMGVYPGEDGRAGHPDDPMVIIETYLDGVLVGGSAEENLGLTVNVAGMERLGIYVPFDGDLSEFVGKTVTLRATIEDACGNSASDELQVVVRQ